MRFIPLEEKFPKRIGERTMVAEQDVWLYKNKWISSTGEGKRFGTVLYDSVWPDMFVKVDCLDREKYGYWFNTTRRKQDGLPPLKKMKKYGDGYWYPKKKRRKNAEF